MATAGRILIMPKGTWNAETTYENLDMVAHSGRAWLAKKVSVGIEPSDANAEFWHDFLGMDVFTEENPPTAEQVGAMRVYTDLSQIGLTVGSETIDSIMNALPAYCALNITITSAHNTSIYPMTAGSLFVRKTWSGRAIFEFYSPDNTRSDLLYFALHNNISFTGWIECGNKNGYLPLTGGTITGNYFGMADHYGYVYANGDETKIGAHNTQEKSPTDERALTIRTSAKTELAKAFYFKDKVNGTTKDYFIFGEHNKPSGTYTGNGSATERTINIGGFCGAVLVTSTSGAAILMSTGGIGQAGSTLKGIAWGQGYYNVGGSKLVIKTDDALLNANGTTYAWRAL